MLRNKQPETKRNPIYSAENVACGLCFCAIFFLAISKIIISKNIMSINIFLVILTVTIVSFALPAIVFSIFFGKKLKSKKFSKEHRGTTVFYISAALLLIVSAICTKSISCYFYNISPGKQVLEFAVGGYWQTLFLYAVLPAIIEEIFFRGIAFSMFEDNCGGLGAIIATSLFFALTHFSLSSFITYLVAGIILAIVMYITRSLILTIILHFINNYISFHLENTVFKITSENNSAILAISLLFVIFLLVLFWFLSELESIAIKKQLSLSDEEQENEKNFPMLLPHGEKTSTVISHIFLSPFTWTSIIIFAVINIIS